MSLPVNVALSIKLGDDADKLVAGFFEGERELVVIEARDRSTSLPVDPSGWEIELWRPDGDEPVDLPPHAVNRSEVGVYWFSVTFDAAGPWLIVARCTAPNPSACAARAQITATRPDGLPKRPRATRIILTTSGDRLVTSQGTPFSVES